MAIAEVIKFEGDPNQLIWKHPVEDFNTTSQLIVDETHEALLVINGNAADLFGPGRHTLSTSNIPLLRNIIEIPTGGKTPFPCKVFFINKVHQMDMKWGTQSAIPLEDPLYDIFMHVMLHGSISISVDESRKFILKMVGFRDRFDATTLISKFRGIISSHVKDAISKIMIDGKLSYFMISSHLLEISEVLQERLSEIFNEYGVRIEFFNIEAIEVPEKDYMEISHAKKLRSGRLIQGYTWQEERQMMIAEKFASNPGSMGQIGGIMGGTMGGIVMGNTISEVARNALGGSLTSMESRKNVADVKSPMGANTTSGAGFDAAAFLSGQMNQSMQQASQSDQQFNQSMQQPVQPNQQSNQSMQKPDQPTTTPSGGKFCAECGTPLQPGAKFCFECGAKVASNVCPGCGSEVKPGMKFCFECGTKLS